MTNAAKNYVYLFEREDIAHDDETEGRLDIVGCFTTSEAAVKCAKSVIHRLNKDHDEKFPAEILEDKKASFYAATIYLLTHPDHVKVTVVKMELEVEHESYESEEEEEEEEDDDDDDNVMEGLTPTQKLSAAQELRAINDTAAKFLSKRARKVDKSGDILSSKKPKTT